MSYWLISVPTSGSSEKAIFDQLNNATKGLSKNHLFRVPLLKVGTLDTLMALSDDLAKYDASVGQVAKKIEKTYFDLQRTEQEDKKEGAEKDKDKDKDKKKDAETEQLRVGNMTSREFVEKFSWNEVRYPKRSPLRQLTDLITKEANKSDEQLKKQLLDYNEIRSSFAAIERKDTGSLLVKSLAPYIKEKDLIEKGHLTTLVLVVPRGKMQEFESSYELLEDQQREKDEAERLRKEAEAAARAEDQAKKQELLKQKHSTEDQKHGTRTGDGEQETVEEKEHEADADHQARLQRAAEEKAAQEAAQKLREEREKEKYKKLPCKIVVPRSIKKLFDDEKDEFVLYRILVMKEGAEYYKNICRERRYTIRPYKHDPAEEQAEKEKKLDLMKKKKELWSYLLRWCSTTYAEIFSSWMHMKAIRLFVESALRYGLPVNFTAMLLEPGRGKENKLRAELKNLYGKLAGGQANLVVTENEPDLSGLTAGEFYPYVYLSVNLLD